MKKFLLLALVCLVACEKQQEDSFLQYLTEVHEVDITKESLRNFYLINVNSCSSCVELNLDYLRADKSLAFDLILTGKNEAVVSSFKKLNYNIIYDDFNKAFKYGLYTQKPLLVMIKDGEVCKKVNIKDDEVQILSQLLKCE
jgi:hypothetical protein